MECENLTFTIGNEAPSIRKIQSIYDECTEKGGAFENNRFFLLFYLFHDFREYILFYLLI